MKNIKNRRFVSVEFPQLSKKLKYTKFSDGKSYFKMLLKYIASLDINAKYEKKKSIEYIENYFTVEL